MATAAEVSGLSYSPSSSSGMDDTSIAMVTLTTSTSEDGQTMPTEKTSSPSTSDDLGVSNSSETFRNQPSSSRSMATEQTSSTSEGPDESASPRTLIRQSSTSSISSTDSCLGEARYGYIHKRDFDFLLWFTSKNIAEAEVIFKVLEKEHHLRGFRYDRDQRIGRVHLLNIAEAIKNSWKILLLFSPEAKQDEWFVEQMYQSLTHDRGKGNVVPILLRRSRNDLPSYISSISPLSYPTPSNDETHTDSPSSSHFMSSSTSSPQLSSSCTINSCVSSSSTSNLHSSSSSTSCSQSSSSNSKLQEEKTESYKVEFDRFVESLINIFTPPAERKRPSSTSRSVSSTSESSSSSKTSRKSQSSLSEESGSNSSWFKKFISKEGKR